MSSCCHPHETPKPSFDPILHGSLGIIILCVGLYPFLPQIPYLSTFTYALVDLFKTMWWGVALGIVFISFMGKIPKAYFNKLLGRGDSIGGILRATIAGLFLDLCSHGIVMVGAKLYERGASLAQVMAFLIASPWNSLSLTLILVSLIGLKWTLIYIAGSAVIAIITGVVYIILVKQNILPDNPHTAETDNNFSIMLDAKQRLKQFKPSWAFFTNTLKNGAREAKMLIKWLLFGMILAAAIRTFFPVDLFQDWFGPSFIGLLLTLGATTIIEVCSEGSAPIAAEIVNRAHAPGNGFAFLMAGVSTDYTEMMVIREFSKSWIIALSLPLITVPQVIFLGYVMNAGLLGG